ncbi:StAR-related lipid transfer protein 3 [Balamuthia mandrillaris]
MESSQRQEWKMQALEARKVVHQYTEEEWATVSSVHGITLSCKSPPGKPKIWKTSMEMPYSPVVLFEHFGLAGRSKWCPQFHSELVETIEEERTETTWNGCTIQYNTSPPYAAGVISARDYVDVLCWQLLEDGSMLQGAISITHPERPPRQGFVRAFNHPCGVLIKPIPDTNKSIMHYIVQTDLKGWLPQRVVDGASSSAFIDMMRSFADYMHRTFPPASPQKSNNE